MGRTRGKRLGAVTRDEERWLDCLERSEINTMKPFTATEAARMVAVTPNKNGTILKNIPLPRKLSHVLRKSPRYEALLKKEAKSTTYWVIKMDERKTHIEWCKSRALECLPNVQEALASMSSDMGKYEGTEQLQQMVMLFTLSMPSEASARLFIEGFN